MPSGVKGLKDYEERSTAKLHCYKSIGFNHKHLFESKSQAESKYDTVSGLPIHFEYGSLQHIE